MDQDSQRRQLGCPTWCRTDHATVDPQTQYISEDGFTIYRERHHGRDVAKVPNPGAGADKFVYVEVIKLDDLETGLSEPPGVNLDGAECMSMTTARVVAAALLDACAMVHRAREHG